jgi:hypothetical protein
MLPPEIPPTGDDGGYAPKPPLEADRRCPICGDARLRRLLRVEGAPVYQNVFAATREAALDTVRGTLDFLRCEGCGLTYNAAFDASLLRYDPAYEVDQSASPRFRAHLDDVCARVAARVPDGAVIVEIGCGQGTFLAHLARRLGPRLRSAIGFDPAFRGELDLPDNVRIAARAFDPAEVAREARAPHLVVLRHTLEHVPDPTGFLRHALSAFPGSAPDVLVETPDADHPVRRRIVYDLYYEHCSLHSAEALQRAMEGAGLADIAIERVFGEEYLLAFGSARPPAALDGPLANVASAGDVAAFAEACAAFAPRWRERLAQAKPRGKVAVWGGAGKGVTFVRLVDPAGDLVDAVIDIHPAKEGKLVPGTAHPIVGPARARALGVRTVVVVNDNYAVEIAERCRAEGWDVEVLRASTPPEGPRA